MKKYPHTLPVADYLVNTVLLVLPMTLLAKVVKFCITAPQVLTCLSSSSSMEQHSIFKLALKENPEKLYWKCITVMLMLSSQALKLGNATVNVVCATLLSTPCTITIACNYMTAHCFFHCEPLHQVVRSSAYFIRNVAQSWFAPCWIISLLWPREEKTTLCHCALRKLLIWKAVEALMALYFSEIFSILC